MAIYSVREKIKHLSWKDLWYRFYVPAVSCLITFALSYGLKGPGILSVVYSENMPGALEAVMTFCSILLGFMGVLLATFAGMKSESAVIRRFLETADPRDFLGVVKKELSSGLGTALVTISLYFPAQLERVFGGTAPKALFVLWLFLIVYFLLSTYRLLSLLLRMIFDPRKAEPPAAPPVRLSRQAREAMERAHSED